MEVKNDSILNMLLRRNKRGKGKPNDSKLEVKEIPSTPTESPIKIKISQTKSMTEKEFETAVREHRRKMSKKYLTKQVSLFQFSFYLIYLIYLNRLIICVK